MTERTREELEAAIEEVVQTSEEDWSKRISRYGDTVGLAATGVIQMAQKYLETLENQGFITHDDSIKTLKVSGEAILGLIDDAEAVLGRKVTDG